MWAAWANDSGGGKTRTSLRVLSISSATRDLLQPQLDGARLRMPFQLRAVLHDQHPELETLPRSGVELAQGDAQLQHRSHRGLRPRLARDPAHLRPGLADDPRRRVLPPHTIAQALGPGEDHHHLGREAW